MAPRTRTTPPSGRAQTASVAAAVIDPPSAAKELPPAELRARVAGTVDADQFLRTGRQSADDFDQALGAVGRHLDGFARILDFGCGSGRILLWLEQLAQRCELHGVDIDSEAVTWAAEHLRYAHVSRSTPTPPLEYPDGFFDLVYAYSVFTHIDEEYQDAWLHELRRVTRPGGLLLVTVHGEHAYHATHTAVLAGGADTWDWDAAVQQRGFLHIRDDAWIGGPFPDYFHTSFHMPWYVYAHWGELFTVRAHLPRRALGYQDVVVLECPAEDSPLEAPLQPVPGSSVAPRPDRTADDGVRDALTRLDAALSHGVDVDAPSRWGPVSRGARRMLLRAIRPYARFQADLDRSLLAAVQRLAAQNDRRRPNRSKEMDPLTREALQRLGDRVSRLEADVRAEFRAQEERRSGRR